MRPVLSLRWKLILSSGSLALALALLLTAVLHLRAERQLLGQLEKTLETKCDEVITVLENAPHPTLEDFLVIETNYRFTPQTYFYEIDDGQGRVLARSTNLGDLELPTPESWKRGAGGRQVELQTLPHPSAGGGRIRLRSERVVVNRHGHGRSEVVIQTAVSLAPFEATVMRNLRDTLLIAFSSLAAVFLLLWYVTTRALQPVAAISREASEITATNLNDRIPLSGRGDELDELARVLNDMLERLGASLRQMEQFSSGAAHQLRTPLTRIRGELDLILRDDVDEAHRAQLERVQEELDRLSRLCGRLLLLARLDQHALDTSVFEDVIDLRQVVAELLEQVGPLAREKGVCLRTGATLAVRVRGSRALLVEALMNLLDNAIRATPPGAAVVVSIDRGGDAGTVLVSVEDGGPGVPPTERERIFQPFYRIPRDTNGIADEGSGLGLAVVRGIAQAHGGRVEVGESSAGSGVFRIALPGPELPLTNF